MCTNGIPLVFSVTVNRFVVIDAKEPNALHINRAETGSLFEYLAVENHTFIFVFRASDINATLSTFNTFLSFQPESNAVIDEYVSK